MSEGNLEIVSEWEMPDKVEAGSKAVKDFYRLCAKEPLLIYKGATRFCFEGREDGNWHMFCIEGIISHPAKGAIVDISGIDAEVTMTNFYGYLRSHREGIRVSGTSGSGETFDFVIRCKDNHLAILKK